MDDAGAEAPTGPAPAHMPFVRRHAEALLIAAAILGGLAVAVFGMASGWTWGQSADESRAQGLMLIKEQEYDAAVRAFTTAIDAAPDAPDAYVYRGMALFESGRPSEAIPDFSKAIELDPDNAVARLYRGDGYLAIGKRDQARADYNGALARAGDDERLATAARAKLWAMGSSR